MNGVRRLGKRGRGRRCLRGQQPTYPNEENKSNESRHKIPSTECFGDFRFLEGNRQTEIVQQVFGA